MTQAAWCWFLWPIIGAMATIPQLGQVLAEGPKDRMLVSFVLGIAYGIGGTAFNPSIRYIGFSLTYAIAVGLSSVLGTVILPLVRGEFAAILSRAGSQWVLAGVAAGAIGIGLCGIAGRLKERDLEAQTGAHKGFSLARGLLLSLLAGVLSAVSGFSLEVAAPLADLAEQHGAGIWKGNIAYMFSNTGAFVSAFLYSLYLARRNRALGELKSLPGEPDGSGLKCNYAFALLTGTLWYGQFFFYNLGHVRLGSQYAFSSWAIHMILLVLFSNLLGVMFKEWRSCRGRTHATVVLGLMVLCTAVVLLPYGNYLSVGEALAGCGRMSAPTAPKNVSAVSMVGSGSRGASVAGEY
jgi:L-rhamnose-H+ transport protein